MSALTDRIAKVMLAADVLPATCGQSRPSADRYRRMARAVEAELQLTEEKHTFSHYDRHSVPGGQMSTYAGQRTQRRWVSAWTEVES